MAEASVWDEATFQLPEVKVASLLDLDPHQSEREELRAAGVSDHRIEALYPRAFEALLPNLLSQMAEIDNSKLIHLCYAEQQLDSILYARETQMTTPFVGRAITPNQQHMDAYLQAAEHEPAFAEVKAYLLKRFGNPRFERGTRGAALASVKVLWCTHWLQAQRHELAAEYVAVTQALDARVCTILGIASSKTSC